MMPDLAQSRLRSAGIARLVIGLLAGAAGLALVGRLDLPAIAATLSQANLALLGLAGAVNLAYFLVRGVRWWLLVQTISNRLSVLGATRMSALGVLMSSIYPGLGEATRLVLLRRYAIPTAGAAAAVIEERLIDTVLFAILLVISAACLPSLHLTGMPSLSGLAVPALAAIVSLTLLAIGVRFAQHRGWISLGRYRWVGTITDQATALVTSIGESIASLRRQPALTLRLSASTLVAQTLAVVTGWIAVSAFGMSISPLAALALVVLINLGLGVLPTPLGLGLYQVAGLTVLGSFAISPEAAVAAATGLQAVNYGATLAAATVSVVPELRWR